MPLDPAAKNLLDLLVAAGRPKVWQLSPPEAREGLRALAEAADAKDVPIGRIENATLAGAEGALPYRSYTPLDAGPERLDHAREFRGRRERKGRPVLVFSGNDQGVEEIQRRRLDAHHRFTRSGDRIGHLREHEIVRPAIMMTKNRPH